MIANLSQRFLHLRARATFLDGLTCRSREEVLAKVEELRAEINALDRREAKKEVVAIVQAKMDLLLWVLNGD